MKALPIFLSLLAGLGGGLLAGTLAGTDKHDAQGTESAVLTPETAKQEALADATARAEIESLRLELAGLRSSMDAMRGEMNRKSVTPESSALAADTLLGIADDESPASLSNLSEEDRDAVFTLMEEARETRRQEQRVEREERQNEWTLTRATQIADELGLPAGSEKKLGEIMLERNSQFSAMRNELNDLGWGPETRTLMRERAGEINQWQTDALTTEYGSEVAGQIQELSGDGRRGGGGTRGGATRGGGGGGR